MDFSRFTDRALKVVTLAKKAAADRGDFVRTEHLLFGLSEERYGIAANVLKNLGIHPEEIEAEAKRIMPVHRKVEPGPQAPFSERLQLVFQMAGEEAKALGHNYVGTEHLLLGLLKEGQGVGCQILMNLGLDRGKVRDELMDLLGVGEEREQKIRAERAAMRRKLEGANQITYRGMEILPPPEFFRLSEKRIIRIADISNAVRDCDVLHIDVRGKRETLCGDAADLLWSELQRRCGSMTAWQVRYPGEPDPLACGQTAPDMMVRPREEMK